MLPSFASQTVTRLRATATATVRGSTVPDWTTPDSATIPGCSVQPASTTLDMDGRVLNIMDSWTLYAPPGADIAEGDRIVHDGNTYVVDGAPRPWTSATGAVSHVQCALRRWRG